MDVYEKLEIYSAFDKADALLVKFRNEFSTETKALLDRGLITHLEFAGINNALGQIQLDLIGWKLKAIGANEVRK